MSRIVWTVVCLAVIGFAASAVQAEEGKEGRGKREGRGGGDFRAKMLEKFDANKDGKLDENERKAAREAFQKEGRPGPNREELIKKFDKDGDGKLSDDEKAAARAAFQKQRGERKPGEGRPERKEGRPERKKEAK